MSGGDCRKVVITIEIPDCDPCAGVGPSDGTEIGGLSQPVPTPFLVIPCVTGDTGTRPVPAAQALYSQAISWTVANPAAPGGWNDFQVQLSCAVANLGAVASPSAMIEFYTGTAIGIWQHGHAALTPAEVKAGVQLVGRANFTAPPGSVTTVTCPRYWVPGSADAAQQGVLVQVRDLFTDPWTAPFDAVNDRHVARNDGIMQKVWNTGVDGNAAKLAPDALDPHWHLVAGPGVTSSRAPFVVTDQHPFGQYFATADSMWIWQDAAGSGDVGSPYTFRLPIDLTGLDPASVRISGAWGVDNDGAITLNGQVPTGTGTFSLTGAASNNYNVEHAFTITGGFVAGINELDIQVTNAHGPAGLNVTHLMISGTPM
ncbi:MAG: hypothetical protein ACRDWG_01585 [Actinomycetes bacterium]